MRLIHKNRGYFGVLKSVYDALYMIDGSHGPYKTAASSVHTQPAEIRVNTCTPS